MFVLETGAKVKRKFFSLNFARSEETGFFCGKRNIARLRVLSRVVIWNLGRILRWKFAIHMISIRFDPDFFVCFLLIFRLVLFQAV